MKDISGISTGLSQNKFERRIGILIGMDAEMNVRNNSFNFDRQNIAKRISAVFSLCFIAFRGFKQQSESTGEE